MQSIKGLKRMVHLRVKIQSFADLSFQTCKTPKDTQHQTYFEEADKWRPLTSNEWTRKKMSMSDRIK